MKICLVVPTLGSSGGNIILFNLAKKIEKLGHDVLIVFPLFIPNVSLWRFKSFYETAKIIYWLGKNILLPNVFLNKKFNLKFKKVLSLRFVPTHFDYYIYSWWEIAFVLDKVLRKFVNSKNMIYLIQGYETWNGNVELVHRTYNLQNRIFTISKYLYKKITIHTEKEVKLLFNDFDFKAPEPLKLEDGQILKIGVIYRSGKLKGFHNYFSAFKKFNQNDFKSCIVGKNIPKKYLNHFDYVFDGSFEKSMKEFYSLIDVLIIPSKDEGFSLPLVEAISYGKLVVIKNIGFFNDLYFDINDLILEDNSPIEIYNRINHLLRLDKKRINQLSKTLIERLSKFIKEIRLSNEQFISNFYE